VRQAPLDEPLARFGGLEGGMRGQGHSSELGERMRRWQGFTVEHVDVHGGAKSGHWSVGVVLTRGCKNQPLVRLSPIGGRPGMFAVEVYAAVRRFVFVDGHSRREAARVFGLSRDTVLKKCF